MATTIEIKQMPEMTIETIDGKLFGRTPATLVIRILPELTGK